MAYIVTLIALALAGVFALLVKVWTGFTYFVLAVLLCLALFWAVFQIVNFFTTFKKRLQENYSLFKAQIINKNNLTPAQYEANEPAYKKEFNKQMLKDKLYIWGLILFSFAVAGSFLAAIILI